MQKKTSQTDILKLNILNIAPTQPKTKSKTIFFIIISILVLWWAFVGAKFRIADLIMGIPQVGDVVLRMMPPNFSQTTNPQVYGVKNKYKVPKAEVPKEILANKPADYLIDAILENGLELRIENKNIWKKGNYFSVLELNSREIIDSLKFNDFAFQLKENISKSMIAKILQSQNIKFTNVDIQAFLPDNIEVALDIKAIPNKYTIPYSSLTSEQRAKTPTAYQIKTTLKDNIIIKGQLIPRLNDKLVYAYSYETSIIDLSSLKLYLKKNITSKNLKQYFVQELEKQKIKLLSINVIENYQPPLIEIPVTMSQVLLPFQSQGELPAIREDFWNSLKDARWWNNIFPNTIIGATIQTIQMALAGTFIALVLAFPLGFLAARNTTPHKSVYYILRGCLNLIRTIPDLALGLIFVSAVGLGAFSGTLALAIHTTSVLAKLLSESIENIDEGVVDAIKATGATYTQILSYAVLPQMLPDLISFTLYRFETNIRAAAILGLIGAGGIGYLMTNAFRTFQYQEAAAIVIILILLVITVDTLSARLRKMVI